MEKIEMIRIGIEVVVSGALLFFATKSFKFKDSLTELLKAVKDGKVTEAECQKVADTIIKDIYGTLPVE